MSFTRRRFVSSTVASASLFALGASMIFRSFAAGHGPFSNMYEFSMAFKLLGTPAVLIAAAALFCYISLEVSMGTWSKPYMTELFGGAANPGAVARAGLILSLFGAAMMVAGAVALFATLPRKTWLPTVISIV
jgi:hypothetical protein